MQNGTNLISNDAPAHGKGKHAHQNARPHKEYVQKREPYYKKRVDLFQQYHQREVDRIAAAKEANKSIDITLPDGKVQTGVAGVTTPMDVAKTLPKSVLKKSVVAKVKSGDAAEAVTWDLLRPLEADSTVELFSFEDKIGKDVSNFSHLTAIIHWRLHNTAEALRLSFDTVSILCRPSGIPAHTFWVKHWSLSLAWT